MDNRIFYSNILYSNYITCFIHMFHTYEGCTWVKKRIKRMANRLFSGSEHRGFQLINSVKKEPKKLYLFLSIFKSFSP